MIILSIIGCMEKGLLLTVLEKTSSSSTLGSITSLGREESKSIRNNGQGHHGPQAWQPFVYVQSILICVSRLVQPTLQPHSCTRQVDAEGSAWPRCHLGLQSITVGKTLWRLLIAEATDIADSVERVRWPQTAKRLLQRFCRRACTQGTTRSSGQTGQARSKGSCKS